MNEDSYFIAHGERGYVCGTKCRFVAYEHDGELAKYLAEIDEDDVGCRVCPADKTYECGTIYCHGGYWVPDPLFNVLRLRGMSGGDDGP